MTNVVKFETPTQSTMTEEARRLVIIEVVYVRWAKHLTEHVGRENPTFDDVDELVRQIGEALNDQRSYRAGWW